MAKSQHSSTFSKLVDGISSSYSLELPTVSPSFGQSITPLKMNATHLLTLLGMKEEEEQRNFTSVVHHFYSPKLRNSLPTPILMHIPTIIVEVHNS